MNTIEFKALLSDPQTSVELPAAAMAAMDAYRAEPTVATLRRLTHMTQAAFGKAYGIPRRTVQTWEATDANGREAPNYVRDLLAYAVIQDIAEANAPTVHLSEVVRKWVVIDDATSSRDRCDEIILGAATADEAYDQARAIETALSDTKGSGT